MILLYIPERANWDNTYPRYYCHCKRTISRRAKKYHRCLIYQEICPKERNASPPISKRSSSKSQNMTRFFSPKKPRIRPLGPGEKIYQWVVTNLPIWQILSIDNTRQKELLFAYFTNPGAFVFIREAFSILKNILVRSYGMPNFPKSFRFEKLIKIDGFVYDEVQEQIYLHVQARGQYDIAFQDYRIPVSQIEGVLHRLIELTTIKT